MSCYRVQTKDEKEIRESIHDRTIIGLWTTIIGPMLFERLPISALDDGVFQKLVCFKSCGEYNDVRWDNSFLGFDTFGEGLEDPFVRKKQIIAVKGLQVATIKDASLRETVLS